MEKKVPSLMIERPKVPRETWDALRAHIMRQRKKNKVEQSAEYKNSMTEKTEKLIPLEFMMRSRNSSGFPTIVGQILGHVDFDTLVSCRLVSKEFKNFLDHKKIWITCLDQVCKKYLDKLLLEKNHPKVKCQGFQVMLPEDIKKKYNSWVTFLEIIKTKGSIKDLINFTKNLHKMPVLTRYSGNRFYCFLDFTFNFYMKIHLCERFVQTGHALEIWICGCSRSIEESYGPQNPIILRYSKFSGAKGDVPKIYGFVHPLHLC